MSGFLVTLCMIILFFVTGHVIECVKRILAIIVKMVLKTLDLFGCHIKENESRIRVSKEFKHVFKDIKTVKKSKLNTKLKPSINVGALLLLCITLVLIILNLDTVSGCSISNWLYRNTFLKTIIDSEQKLEVTYVAILFSVMSFCLSKIMHQWKETREMRKARRLIRARDRAFSYATSKELLDAAKLRDEQRYADRQPRSKEEEC